MSQTVSVGGTTYTIPDQGDPPNWGTNLTPFFVALAAEVATSPSYVQNVVANSTPVTVTTEKTYLAASNTLAITFNLPAPVQNLWFAIKDTGFNAAVNNITIHRYASEQINGVASDKVCSISGGYWVFACDGTNWFMFRDAEALNPLKATNQLVITPSNGLISTTISAPVPVASRVYTIQDAGAAANFVMSESAQTINGVKTFGSAPILSAGATANAAVTISPTTNQLVLGATRTVTINAPTPASLSRTHTIPDVSASANFVLDQGTYTIGGTWTLSNALTISPVTNQIVLGATRTVTITAPTPASLSRVVTFPDLAGDYSVVGTIAAQTIAGVKTFSSGIIGASGTTSAVTIGVGTANNGIYSGGTNIVGVVTAGSERWIFDASGNFSANGHGGVIWSGPANSATFPDFSFYGDTNSGLRSTGADTIALTTGATDRLTIGAVTSVTGSTQLIIPDGTNLLPGIAFSNGATNNFGLYFGSSALNVSVGASQQFQFASGFFGPVGDNARLCGQSGQRWSAVWAGNGTIQTSMSSTKKEIREVSAKDLPLPKAAVYKRAAGYDQGTGEHEIFGFLADGLPEECFAVVDVTTGERSSEDVYTSSVLGIALAHIEDLTARISALEKRG